MLYLDTCVLLAVLTPETHSEVATQALAESTTSPAISPWTTTELHSALGLKVRPGRCGPADLPTEPGAGAGDAGDRGT